MYSERTNAVIPSKRSASRKPTCFCGNVVPPAKESLDSHVHGIDHLTYSLIRLLSGTDGQYREVCGEFPKSLVPKAFVI